MAKAFRCDACGNLYEYYDGILVQGRRYGFNSIILRHDDLCETDKGNLKTYDLCPSCCAKINDLIKAGGQDIERQEM